MDKTFCDLCSSEITLNTSSFQLILRPRGLVGLFQAKKGTICTSCKDSLDNHVLKLKGQVKA